MRTASELATHVRSQMEKVIVGQREALDQLFLVLLVGGHALVEGVPGLAKTLAERERSHPQRNAERGGECHAGSDRRPASGADARFHFLRGF